MNRIYVATKTGSECVAYSVTKGFETKTSAVMFFDGDSTPEKFADAAGMAKSHSDTLGLLQHWSGQLKVRYVSISRLGLNGSSGHHGERRTPHETLIMNTAIDLIKQRLGLQTIGLAGQSGGSTIAASILALGRRDIECAALGSGAYEVVDLYYATLTKTGSKVNRAKLEQSMFDPARDVADVPADPKRRLFILGDEADTRTPWAQQKRYAASLIAHGHHATLIPVEASGELDHAATRYTIPTAGGCLTGASDDKLIIANRNLTEKAQEAEERARPAAPSASMALMREAK